MNRTSLSEKSVTTPLESKLSRHFLACSAFVGTAAFMVADNASANPVYYNEGNYPVATTNGAGGIYLDMETGGILTVTTNGSNGGAAQVAANLPGWDVNIYGLSKGLGNLSIYYSSTTTFAFDPAKANHVAVLPAGTQIDGSLSFGTHQTMMPDWGNTNAFVGVHFMDHNGATHYGWIQLQTSASGTGFPVVIVATGFDDGVDTLSVAGANPAPEPSTLALGCLAAGASGLVAWRKRKKN